MDTAPLVGRDAQPQSSDALLQDAVVASRVGDGDRALALLRSCVAQQHFNPTAHYLLGAEQAQRQAYGDAVVHMTTAIEQAPTLWVARLQLGLLWLTLANPTAALTQLQPMSELPRSDALRDFADALISLCRDDLEGAAEHLRAGLLMGTDNAALAADMQRLLGAVEEKLQPVASATSAPESSASVSHDMAISAYMRRTLGEG